MNNRRYLFYVCLSGEGLHIDPAWQDACEQFCNDFGGPPVKISADKTLARWLRAGLRTPAVFVDPGADVVVTED